MRVSVLSYVAGTVQSLASPLTVNKRLMYIAALTSVIHKVTGNKEGLHKLWTRDKEQHSLTYLTEFRPLLWIFMPALLY